MKTHSVQVSDSGSLDATLVSMDVLGPAELQTAENEVDIL